MLAPDVIYQTLFRFHQVLAAEWTLLMEMTAWQNNRVLDKKKQCSHSDLTKLTLRADEDASSESLAVCE